MSERIVRTIEAEKFSSLSAKDRGIYLSAATYCALQARDVESAYKYAIRATAIPGAEKYAWFARFGIEVGQKRHAEAIATLALLRKERPELLGEIDAANLSRLHSQLKDAKEHDARLSFLRMVTSEEFTPANPFFRRDFYRLSLATILLEKGQGAEAKRVLAMLADPSAILEASFDPVFAKIFAPPDLRTEAERELARTKGKLAKDAGWLSGFIESARLERMLGRPEAALATLNELLPRIQSPQQFRDPERQNWYWNSLSLTFRQLGRFEEALDAFKNGAKAGENGAPNVSQIINLAGLQGELGRFEEAVKTTEVISFEKRGVSPYGEMELRSHRGCSLARLKRLKEAEADFGYARDHQADNAEAFTRLAICMGQLDAAAASIVKRLDSTDTRHRALMSLMDFDPPFAKEPDEDFARSFAQIKKRPDIQAALRRHGGVRRIPLQESEARR